jgi:A/G-specific adenine glycosylase
MPGPRAKSRAQHLAVDDSVRRVGALRVALLDWYDRNARDLPWRAPPGANAPVDPYRVWLSEIMLQQTTVAAVAPYYERFLEAWPTVEALAAAPREDVLSAWAGLGYYSRARNLHAAAQVAAAGGGFPADEAGLRALPGVGPYTAAAIASIAHGVAANVVDGNVERVMARLHAVETPLPEAKPELAALAGGYVRSDRPGDWAQALMDLGATVCTPRSPACEVCPVAFACAARAGGAPETYPRRRAKAPKPVRHGVAFRLRRGDDILLVRRPDKGLLGGMAALPTTPWRAEVWSAADAELHAPASATWREIGAVAHVFTHFALTLAVWEAEGDIEGDWRAAHDLGALGLPTVFRKAAALG